MADLREFMGGWLFLRLEFDIPAIPEEPDHYSLHGTGHLFFNPDDSRDDRSLLKLVTSRSG
jgi:hypothetical protein